MATIWDDLLAADDIARRQGAGGMHPRLRKAVEAGSTLASRPGGQAKADQPEGGGENVVWLFAPQPRLQRGRA
jgi:hypothetical protein